MKIVSLGTNCEASFRIQDYTGKPIDSYIFTWTATYEPLKQIKALENLRTLEDSSWFPAKNRLVVNERYHIGFHFKDSKNLFDAQGNLNQEEYDTGLIELKSRMAHLIDKTERLLENENMEDILFVYKAEMYHEEEYTFDYILLVVSNLYSVLKNKVQKGNFMLMVLLDKKPIYEQLFKINFAPNVSFHYLTHFPGDTERNNGGDKVGWNNAFHDAICRFEQFKLEKYSKNLIKGMESEFWIPTKSGDAIGSYDSAERIIKCESQSYCYYGIMHDVDPQHLKEKTLKLSLKISNVNSERKDVGYLQIWENHLDKPTETKSAFLLNINNECQYYEFLYKVPDNLKRLRVVIQTKNGSFKIDDVKLTKSILN